MTASLGVIVLAFAATFAISAATRVRISVEIVCAKEGQNRTLGINNDEGKRGETQYPRGTQTGRPTRGHSRGRKKEGPEGPLKPSPPPSLRQDPPVRAPTRLAPPNWSAHPHNMPKGNKRNTKQNGRANQQPHIPLANKTTAPAAVSHAGFPLCQE